MKKLSVFVFILLVSMPVFAFDKGMRPRVYTGDPRTNNGYASPTGAKYKYDLSDPGDRIRYKCDVEAQIRDNANGDARKKIDHDLGFHGGGME